MAFTRTLISGTSQLMLGNGVVRLFSIFTMPILTHLLDPQAYGVATLAGTIISLVSVFALAGIDMSYVRAYHSEQPPNGAAVEQYCWRFAIMGALSTAMLAGVAWWLINRESVALDRHLAIFVALGIIFSVANIMAQTRSCITSDYRGLTIAIVVSGLLSSGANIGIAAIWRQDALALVLPMLLGYLIPVLLLGMPAISGLIKRSSLTSDQSVTLVKIGLGGVITAPMYWIMSSCDRWFLQHYHGATAVGVYSIGYNVGIVGMMLNSAVTSVWRFEAAKEYEQDPARAQINLGRLMSRLAALMGLIWLAVTASGGDVVRLLTNARFHEAAVYVPYIAGAVFFHGILHLANTSLLLAKRMNSAAFWWSIGGIICILFNFPLVSNYGALGAAITQTVSVGLICLATFVSSQAKLPLLIDWNRLTITALIIVPAGILLTHPWHEIPLFSLLMKLPVGMAIASAVALIMEPMWCGKSIQYLRRWAAA